MKTAHFKKVDLLQGSPEWKAWRRFKIGASEIAAIMGDCPYNTPLQLYEKKISGIEDAYNPAMEAGHENEIKARDYINKNTESNYQPDSFESIKYPWLIASLDGWDENSAVPILEIKYTKKEWHEMIRNRDIPKHFQWQLQQQMLVMGVSKVLFVSYKGKDSIVIIVEENPIMQPQIIQSSKIFYDRMMNFDPPPACEHDNIKIEDESLIGLLQRYKRLTTLSKSNELEMQEIKSKVITHLERENIKRAIIGNSKISYTVSKGKVDYKSLAEKLIPEDILIKERESFRSDPIESWRFS